jgi:hypothetical protein
MENFITGYTGHEHQLREAMLEVLGKDKYEFFDKVSDTYRLDHTLFGAPLMHIKHQELVW